MTKTKKTEEETVSVKTEEKAETKKMSAEIKSEEDLESKKAKLAKLLEKAKSLEKGVKEAKEISKEEVKKKKGDDKDIVEKKEMLVPIEDYLKSSIYLGTRVITPDMKSYVYRRRADGLAVFNTSLLDEKLKECAEYLAKFEPKDIIVVCKREAGWKAAAKFASTFGMRFFTKKYPAGILTNTNLVTFQEANLIFICDPWLDKNAFMDAQRIKIPVMSVCDTNNYTRNITQILPGNNKSAKSLGFIFFIMAKLYAEKRKIDIKIPQIQEYVDDWDNLQPPK